MDDDVALLGLRIVNDLLDLFNDLVAVLQVPIARQGEVKIDVEASAGTPGTQAVYIDPGDLAAGLQGLNDMLEERRVSLTSSMPTRIPALV